MDKPKKEKKPNRFATYYKELSHGGKVKFWISWSIVTLSLAIIALLCFARDIFGQEVGDKILGEGNANAFVSIGSRLISDSSKWIGTVIIVIMAFFLIFVINTLIGIFSKATRRTKTIGSLLRSFVKYGVIILAVGSILALWGVDIAGIIAGLGVVTLIIGLGCQSLIQDVVSGIFIVFDDYYQVGDIVVIDDFRGTVIDVGLRTTKLKSGSGNIKSFTNSSIKTVENLTRDYSMVTVDQVISIEEDIERVEAIIARCLPEIEKSIPAIKKGLWYKGINGSDAYAGIKLLFLCFCDESDRFQVTRDLTRELMQMCKKEGINIPYSQFTISMAEKKDWKTATEEEKEASIALTNGLRGIENDPSPKPKKKKKFLKRAEESIKEVTQELLD